MTLTDAVTILTLAAMFWLLYDLAGAFLRWTGYERWVEETVVPAVQRKLDERLGDRSSSR